MRIFRLWCGLMAALLLASTASHAVDRTSLEALLHSPERDLADKIADPIRRPLEVLEFLGIRAGMQVLDMYAGGGYYTLILSQAVGSDGTVYAQNSPRALAFQEDRTDTSAGETIARKLEAHQLSNVVRMDESFFDINFLPNSLDAVMVSRIFHDYYNRDPRRAQQTLLVLKRALKPGGVIGLIDHHGDRGNNNRRFHRIVKQDVLDAVAAAGLVTEAESELLRNPQDSRRRSIFDPMLNRHTDRFLLRIIKPKEVTREN